MLEQVERGPGLAAIAAVGHRVVHGGDRFVEPALVTAEMLDQLRRISPLDPEHLPGEIALIEAIGRAIPGVPQVACFDTAFHRAMPRPAQIVPIPRRYWGLGVRRYGFHGLSYAYLMEELARAAGPAEARGRVVLAHLGSGASLAAVREGRCLDTTMGFTPASGLVMGTRCGDLDPGLVAFLARAEGMTPERFHRMVNQESGLLGVSETSPDLRDLLARRADRRPRRRGRRPVLLPRDARDRGHERGPRRAGRRWSSPAASARTPPRSAAAPARGSGSSGSPSTTCATRPASR